MKGYTSENFQQRNISDVVFIWYPHANLVKGRFVLADF